MTNVTQFPRTGHVDLMHLTLSILEQCSPTAEEIAETLRKRGYFGVNAEAVIQAIDGLRRNDYAIHDWDDIDGVRYQLVVGGSAA